MNRNCPIQLPAEPGFGRREPKRGSWDAPKKEGAHGGTMGSPMLFAVER
jgi:hypothetical protein